MRQGSPVTIMPRPQQLGETLVTITVPQHVANCAKKVLIDSILQTKIPACRLQSTACWLWHRAERAGRNTKNL